MNESEVAALDWSKGAGLLPAVVQDFVTGKVLMLGCMNPAALRQTLAERRVTFYSRSRARLWTKGESSGNFIAVESVTADCDRDALLIVGRPLGPVCHTGAPDCFDGQPSTRAAKLAFLERLEAVIAARIAAAPASSYSAQLHARGPARIAQKVGEEALEVALAAVSGDNEAVISESADLLYHLLLLLQSRGKSLLEVVSELESRHALRV
jgi:phosphoribosyl-AMP cyclohydrolase / phosphoribosyl-ATP pyrophosphohydrolase